MRLSKSDNFKRSRYFKFWAGWGMFLFFQTSDGCLWCCGSNVHGNLALFHTKNVTIPEKVKFFPCRGGKEISKVAIGQHHTLLQTRKAGTYSCGSDREGQLSIGGSKAHSYIPKLILLVSTSKGIAISEMKRDRLERVASVYCAMQASYFLLVNGDVYSSGWNNCGSLGLNRSSNANIGEKIRTLSNITDIFPGDNWVLFMSRTGDIFGVGANGCGPLGVSDSNHHSVPKKVTFFDKATPTPLNVRFAMTVGWTTYFTVEGGDVYCSGHSANGEFGNGQFKSCTPEPVLCPQLSGYDLFCTGLTDKFILFRRQGVVYGCGKNSSNYGVVQDGESLRRLGTPTEIPSLRGKNIIQLVTGYTSSYAICKDGRILACGHGESGQLMNGKRENLNEFEFVGRWNLRRNGRLDGVHREKNERLAFLSERVHLVNLCIIVHLKSK